VVSNDTYLTIVYRNVKPGDETRRLTEDPRASALSWGHGLKQRDILQETVDCQAAEIASLKAALEHAQQQVPAAAGQPVAWRDPTNFNPGQAITFDSEVAQKWPHIYKQPLYAAAQAAQPANEARPVALALQAENERLRTELQIAQAAADAAVKRMAAMRSEMSAATAAQPAQPEAWQKHARKLVEWRHCMSYNDSYFGEPAGLLKQIAAEFERLLPPHELAAAPAAQQDGAVQTLIDAGHAPAEAATLIAESRSRLAAAAATQAACWIDQAELRNIAMEGCTPSVSAQPVSEHDVPLYTRAAAMEAQPVKPDLWRVGCCTFDSLEDAREYMRTDMTSYPLEAFVKVATGVAS
jgi:hypothetical protein